MGRIASALPVLLLLVLVLPVAAADEEDPGKALLARLVELRKAEDSAGLATAMAEVPPIYTDEAHASLRSKFRSELGKIAKDKDLAEARIPAIETLVAINDPKGAYKELSRLLPGPKEEEVDEISLAALRATGRLAASRAIKTLTELAYKARNLDVMKAAVIGLGGYGEDVKNRVKILEELVTVGLRTRPGQSTTIQTSDVARDRWAALERPLVGALNALTGQKVASFGDWEALWDQYERRPKTLFETE